MSKQFLSTLLACAFAAGFSACASPEPQEDASSPEAVITANALSARPPRGKSLVVSVDTRLKPGEHYLPALGEDGDQGVVVLEGLSGVTLDLTDVILRGLPEDAPLDAARGTGVVLRDCREVRVLGGELRGYRVGLFIDSCRDIVVEGVRVTSGYASELSSTPAAPDPLDRLEVENEDGAWFSRYGAGLFVRDSSRVELRDCEVRESQNGIVLVRSGDCTIEDNDTSYLSGWGIALDRSEDCELLGNRCDFVARAAHPGRYAEDYGAAGILVVGGSSEVLLVSNSTVRSSVGISLLGAPDAPLSELRIAKNELSEPVVRSLRAEHVSDSWIVDNDAQAGGPGGFELRSCARLVLAGNRVERVFGAGIGLVDSEACVIAKGAFTDCDRGLELHGGREHLVSDCVFSGNLQDLVLEGTRELVLVDNDFDRASPDVHLDGLHGLALDEDETTRDSWGHLADAEGDLPGGRAENVGFAAYSETPSELGAALLWATGLDSDARGSGNSAGELRLGTHTPWDPAGGSNSPSATAGLGLLDEVTWEASWFSWDEGRDPRGDLEAWRSLRYEPAARARVRAWTEPWGGSARVRREVGAEHFGLHARGEVYVSRAGTYILGAVSDDGLRVWLDDEIVYEDWTWHPAKRVATELELDVGRHSLEFEYFQIDGAAELSLELDRAR